MEVKEYLDRKGLQYKVIHSSNGDQFNLRSCPFCGKNDYHFYISAVTGQYYCHHGSCGASGGFLTLKKHLGDALEPQTFPILNTQNDVSSPFSPEQIKQMESAHQALLQDKEALLYLAQRKFTSEAIKHFKLGVVNENGIKWLLIPYYQHDMLINVKMRSLPPSPKKFRRWEGGLSTLFNEDALTFEADFIIITEGETDCLALWSQGIKNVIGVSLGASGFKPEWLKLLDKFKTIYLAYDNDIAGSTGAKKLASKLGLERCKSVRLPADIKDVNEFFIRGHTRQDFETLLESAESFEVENVQSIGNIIRQRMREVLTGVVENKLSLPWTNVDKLIDGLGGGDLVTIGGRPGTGKSTFVLNILYHQAINNIPSLLFSLEMPLWRLLPRIVSLHKRLDSKICNNYEILANAYDELRNMPLYFAYKYDKPTWTFIADTIRASVKYHNIQIVAFDNLHFLCRSISHQTEEVSYMIQNFKLLAEELSIPILVIARPRKTQAKVISGEDLKDSADIEGDSDIILILHRDRKKSQGEDVEGVFEPLTMVIADKVRYSVGGSTFLFANDAEARFDEITK